MESQIEKENVAVVLGGSGYIAGYTINYIFDNDIYDSVYIVDIKEPRREVWTAKTAESYQNGTLVYLHGDVRETIIIEGVKTISCIFNYAAIHREPGHEDIEYFETNIKGAENCIALAKEKRCSQIIFTSSIAPYGHADIARTEKSQVVPYSPYGSSKLVAEKIHEGWQSCAEENALIIIRPGVIFGPHEDGNVPRLRDALKKGYFCYVGNKQVRKSGGYVKELVNSIFWVKERQDNSNEKVILYNFSFPEPPMLEEYVRDIIFTLGIRRSVPTIPFKVLLALSYCISFFSNLFNIKQPIHPKRIKKLTIDNTIVPEYLITNSYPYKYTLLTCLEDWKHESPREW